MTAGPAMPIFPDTNDFAQAFYTEAARHLLDAKILHETGRVAAAFTSLMKAAELGIKAAFILENAVGYYEKIYQTHKPLTDALTHPLLKRVPARIESHRPGLLFEIRDMEQMEPTQFGKKNYGPEEANSEYPFLMMGKDTSGNDIAELKLPGNYFTTAQSLAGYRSVLELLEALPVLYPAIAAWAISLPPLL